MKQITAHRKTFLTALGIVLLISLMITGLRAETRPANIGDMLPVGVIEAEVLDVTLPERANELAEKLTEAAAEQPEWFKQYIVENAVPGEPLPYHPNFGITKAEYEELLGSWDERQIVVKTTMPVRVENKGGDYYITTDGKAPSLDGTIVHAGTMHVSTKYGTLTEPEWLQKEDGPIGPWEGYSWKLEEGDVMEGNAKSVSFSLDRLEGGKILLSYEVSVMDNGKISKHLELSLRFPAPQVKNRD